jgi:endonuclease/exonuclease/phosphatase (EEP) superfamily protein YafD
MTASVGYLAVVVLTTGLVSSGLDWWPLTLVRFGPRWCFGSPLMVLGPWALAVRPRALAVLSVSAAVVVGPLMGFNVPWRRLGAADPAGVPRLQVLTLNVEHAEVRHRDRLAGLIARTRPDVVAFQEFSGPTADLFPAADGWSVTTSGGLGLASRLPIERAETLDVHDPTPRRAVLRGEVRSPRGTLVLAVVHLTTPRDGLEALLKKGPAGVPDLVAADALRRRVSAQARRWLGEAGPLDLVAGDFNQTTDDPAFRRTWSDLRDAFESVGLGLGLTRFARGYGVRIDHVLAGPGWRVRGCRVGPDVGSDHRPVIAELERLPPG